MTKDELTDCPLDLVLRLLLVFVLLKLTAVLDAPEEFCCYMRSEVRRSLYLPILTSY